NSTKAPPASVTPPPPVAPLLAGEPPDPALAACGALCCASPPHALAKSESKSPESQHSARMRQPTSVRVDVQPLLHPLRGASATPPDGMCRSGRLIATRSMARRARNLLLRRRALSRVV